LTDGVVRLVVFVVAPTLSARQITALRGDPEGLPARRVVHVDAATTPLARSPRNAARVRVAHMAQAKPKAS
jgi:hypothetical protein